jgi:hypothetical protein
MTDEGKENRQEREKSLLWDGDPIPKLELFLLI